MVHVGLAGGQVSKGAVTQHGEIMFKERGDKDRSWVIPVSRLVVELGINLTWTRSEIILTAATGRKIVAPLVG